MKSSHIFIFFCLSLFSSIKSINLSFINYFSVFLGSLFLSNSFSLPLKTTALVTKTKTIFLFSVFFPLARSSSVFRISVLATMTPGRHRFGLNFGSKFYVTKQIF